ncbi:hypothetical protein BDV18DRAFT_14151 [Aspergillus unguis]
MRGLGKAPRCPTLRAEHETLSAYHWLIVGQILLRQCHEVRFRNWVSFYLVLSRKDCHGRKLGIYKI